MCYLIAKIYADVKWLILFFVRKRLLMVLLCSILPLRGTIFAEAGAFDEFFMIKDRTALSCNIVADGDFIKADCSDLKYVFEVPQTLEKLKVLNLSYNYIKNITKESFKKYQDTLTVLDMSHMVKWTKAKEVVFSADSFLPLFKLEYLDLSESCYNIDFQFPSKIRILIIENCSTTVQVSGLNSLEEFYGAGNAWRSCPKFHPLAPLRYIDLRRNNLFSFEIDRIAPLCYLSTLRMNTYIPPEKLAKRYHNATTYCSCTALETWLTSIEVNHEPLNCTLPEGVVAVCDEKSIEEASQLRQKCLAKITPHIVTSIETNWLLILTIVLVFSFLALPVVVNMTVGFLNERAELAARQKEQDEEEQNESEEEETPEEEEDKQEVDEDRKDEAKEEQKSHVV